METIYDYNITKEEEIILFGVEMDRGIFDKSEATQRQHYNLIYKLLKIRGNDELASEIANKIPNDEDKIFTLCNIDH